MRKALTTLLAAGAALGLVVAQALPAGANLVSPTPATGSTIHGTVQLKDDGSNSGGINLLITNCNGSTTITVKNSAGTEPVNQTVNGTGGQGAPIPLGPINWVTDQTTNGAWTITGTDVKKTSVCLSSSTTTTTSAVTVTNTGELAYGGDTQDQTGTNANVKATLTDENGFVPPTGTTVTFALSGGGSVNATTNASGVASTTLAVTGAPRTAQMTVSYAGTYYTAATSVTNFTVQADTTTTSVTSSLNPSIYGQSETFHAIVSAGVGGTPTGSVQFSIDGTNLGSPVTLSSGSATSIAAPVLTAGNHAVLATYIPTGNFGASSGSVTQVVNQATTMTTLQSSANPSVFGQSITFTATVSVITGAGTPTGFVTFQENGQPIGGQVALQSNGTAQSAPISVLPASNTSYTITATYSGDPNFVGSSVQAQQTVNKAMTSLLINSSQSPSVFGQAVSFSTTVSAVSPGAGTPTGTVTYTVDGNALPPDEGLTGGQATSSTVATLAPGDHTVSVTYNGDSDFDTVTQTFTQVVNQAQTTTSISSDANPSVWGQPVTFSASVAVVSPGAGTPTGTVTFTVDGNQLGNSVTIDANGDATSDPTSSLSVGGHTVVATYSGDTDFSGSSNQLTQTVNQAQTTTHVSSSVDPTVFGQETTFAATVSVTAPGAGTPTGNVVFSDGSNVIATVGLAGVLDGGTASFSTNALSVGTHAITAAYSGDTDFLGSQDVLTQTVNQAQTTTSVASNGAVVQGQPATFTATVAPVLPGAGMPTGTVQFSLNGAPEGSPVALGSDGTATSAPISGLTPGQYTVTAAYSGDTDFLPSSGSTGQTVTTSGTSTTLQVSPDPAAFGATVTFTATVTPTTGVGSPTGTVDFFDGSTLIGTGSVDPSTGKATFSTSSLAAGDHSLTASYLGEADFDPSTSSAVSEAVGVDPTTTSLTASPNPSVFNSPVTLTATVTPNQPSSNTPSGSITFFDGANSLGTVSLGANATASLSVSTLSVGSHQLSAEYTGDGTFGGGVSADVTQQVTKEPTTVKANSPSGTTLVATLSSAQGPLGGQTLTFKTGSTTICTSTTAANGTASCNDSKDSVQVALNGYTASFAGNASYLPSSGKG